MTREEYLFGICEFRDEIPDLLVSSAFLAERLKEPMKNAKFGAEILNLVKKQVKLRKFDENRLKELYEAYSALYIRISSELSRLCELSEQNSNVVLSPRLSRWYRTHWRWDYV
jgi:DNA repair exonuclease SbcCD ATPase subunit